MNKEELLAETRMGRERLLAVLAGLTDAQMAELVNGDWTRTDVLAHIEAWERRTLRLLSILRGERDFDPDEPGEVDAFNAWSHERNRGRALAEVRDSEAAAYEDLLATISAADEAELADPTRFEFLEGRPLTAVVVENMSGHYAEHLDQLRA